MKLTDSQQAAVAARGRDIARAWVASSAAQSYLVTVAARPATVAQRGAD